MSHTATGGQPPSPPASGRSSPVHRPPRRPIEDGLYKKDKGYRRYAAGVERALALFDTAQQVWADYISFLGRLLKAIQAHPSDVPIIPHSTVVATRLAQCLNPSLPAGVHQKTIELYAYVFSVIGREGLSRDLYLYLPGLAPVLSFASLSVRPSFIALVEKHVVPLETYALRPALKSIILCLLPGLEEETSEDFERILQLLDSFRTAFGDSGVRGTPAGSAGDAFFWQCFFLATITNPSRRQGALAFLVRKLPKLASEPHRRASAASGDGAQEADDLSAEAQAVLTPEPGLLVRCFAAGLSDSQLLVQRGFLDLLVTHLSLQSPLLQEKISPDDLDLLVTAAAGVVTRRDMSLNRRLWSWFLGPDPPAGSDLDGQKSPLTDVRSVGGDLGSYQAEYFSRYGLQSLSRSIMAMIKVNADSPMDRAKPFRICLSLMDRWEVGGLIIPETFLPALESAYRYSEVADKQALGEVLRSASNYFDGVESGLIWGKIMELIASALGSGSGDREDRRRKLRLARFIITRFNVREEEMLVHHIPLVTVGLLISLNDYARAKHGADSLDSEISSLALSVLEVLLQLIPDRTLAKDRSGGRTQGHARVASGDRPGAFRSIRAFYTDGHGNVESLSSPLSAQQISETILLETGRLFALSLQASLSRDMSDVCTRQLCSAIQKTPNLEPLQSVHLLEAFHRALGGARSQQNEQAIDFPIVLAITAVVMSLQSARSDHRLIDEAQMADLMPPLISTIWYHLSPFRVKYHVEAVRCLWQLQAITAPERRVEAAITSLMADSASNNINSDQSVEDAGRRFAILWTHTVYEHGLRPEKAGRNLPRRSSGLPGADLPSAIGNDQSVLTRPLMILLDSLADESTGLYAFVRSWLQDLPSLGRILDVLLGNISQLRCFSSTQLLGAADHQHGETHFLSIDDSAEFHYYLQHIFNILKWPSEHVWNVLAGDTVLDQDTASSNPQEAIFQVQLAKVCMHALKVHARDSTVGSQPHVFDLHRTALCIITQLLSSPHAEPLREMELEVTLIERLYTSLERLEPLLQTTLLEALLAALRLRLSERESPPPQMLSAPKTPNDAGSAGTRPAISVVPDKEAEKDSTRPVIRPAPPKLLDCLRAGIGSPKSRIVLDSWVAFLGEVLPLFADSVFQNLLPLVGCFCEQIGHVFNQLKTTFREQPSDESTAPEPTLICLMHGLEQILAHAHDQLVSEETRAKPSKSPEQPQGFFGHMVSGVFSSEAPQSRSATANDRLSVLICFQDTVRICFSIWSWSGYGSNATKPDPTSLASLNYSSLRMRNRARRILEHLFVAESLECLETLAVLWCHSAPGSHQASAVLNLLNVLNGSRPKNIIPAIFNAVYSRTNPNALDPNRMSTLTSDLADTDLVSFLVDYTQSLEDDAMDEIWPDCTAFLRDVLANPMPHRQILPTLLEFTTMLADKVDNTNFGEQRKMRKDLGDLFVRLLTATFTTRSLGFLQDPTPSQLNVAENAADSHNRPGSSQGARASADIVTVLAGIAPRLTLVLVDNDRVASAAASISTHVIGPAIKAKAFPANLSKPTLDLIQRLTRINHASKTWKKDVSDAFNDPRFFHLPVARIQSHWMSILRQWCIKDKERMPELLSRLSAPTTAGIMFGVGAASARLEADRRTQLTLRRMALLVLAAPEDNFVPNIRNVEEKVVELFTATAQSSPSSATRTEAFLLLRALVLQITPTSLAPLWPIINAELHAAISSLLPDAEGGSQDRYNNASLVQACKLLDALVAVAPDDFQLYEWLFITDTIDAVYRPEATDSAPAALADEVADGLGDIADAPTPITRASHAGMLQHAQSRKGLRQPFLDSLLEHMKPAERQESGDLSDKTINNDAGDDGDEPDATMDLRALSRQELIVKVLRPFFSQLSIWGFDATYAMGKVDFEAVRMGLLKDLFDVGGLAD